MFSKTGGLAIHEMKIGMITIEPILNTDLE